jgi:NAD-dependent dihydropyrimidine dehydrogenase PreA subunit
MKIDVAQCIGCGKCIPYCPVGVIVKNEKIACIDDDECVECGICLNNAECPRNAIYQNELEWPRLLRAQFSNPMTPHSSTGITGRGTEEMKSNDVTGRFKSGMFGIGIELGRPGIGARIYDVEKVAMGLAEFVDEFEPVNPVTQLMSNKKRGKFESDVLNEKVLSAIVEFTAPLDRLSQVLERTKQLADQVDTVFVVSLISILDNEGNSPVMEIAKKHGFSVGKRTKINVGLGRIPQKSKETIKYDTHLTQAGN